MILQDKHILSKSTYIKSLQCLKSLFLYKYHYKLRDPLPYEVQQRFKKGHDIGKLAQQLFPGGIDCTTQTAWDYRNSLILTQSLISKNYDILYEACFQFEKVLAIADILVKRNNEWYVYEVKSSLSISETYLQDAALQYFVISNCGLTIADFRIIHLHEKPDTAFSKKPNSIFNEQSVIDYCIQQTDFVKEKIEVAKKIVSEKKLPDISPGEHCNKPYKCDFFGFCHQSHPQPGKLF